MAQDQRTFAPIAKRYNGFSVAGSILNTKYFILNTSNMISVLYGKNNYSRITRLNEIIAGYGKKDSQILLERFDISEEGGLESLEKFLSGLSLFNPKKFAVVDNVFETKDKKRLKKILESALNDKETILIVTSDEEPSKTFGFLLEKPAAPEYFPEIDKKEANIFISSEAKRRGLLLDKDSITNLAQNLGDNLWAIATELDRLALSKSKEITAEFNEEYFPLLNSLKSSNLKTRIVALEKLLTARGDEPARIFNGLAYGFGTERIIRQLADYDVSIKSGKLDYEEVLLDLVLS